MYHVSRMYHVSSYHVSRMCSGSALFASPGQSRPSDSTGSTRRRLKGSQTGQPAAAQVAHQQLACASHNRVATAAASNDNEYPTVAVVSTLGSTFPASLPAIHHRRPHTNLKLVSIQQTVAAVPAPAPAALIHYHFLPIHIHPRQ